MTNDGSSTKAVFHNLHYFLSGSTGQRLIERLCGPDALDTTSFLPTLYDLLFADICGDTVSGTMKGVYEASRPVGDSVNYVRSAQQWFIVYLRNTLLSSLAVSCSPAYTSGDMRHSFERSISVPDTVMELCDCHCYHLLVSTTLSDSTELDAPNPSTAPSDSMGDPVTVDIPYALLTLYPSSSPASTASQASTTIRLGLGQHMIAAWSEDQQLEWRAQWWAAIHKLLILYTNSQSTHPPTQTQAMHCTPVLSDLFKQQMLSLMLSELHSIYRDILRLQPQHQLKGKKKQGKQYPTNKSLSGSNNSDTDSKTHELYAFLPSIYETSVVYITAFKQWIIDILLHTLYSQKGHNSDLSNNILLLIIQVPLYILKSITRDIVYDEEAEVIDIEKEYLTHWMDILHKCSIQHTIQYKNNDSSSNSNVQDGSGSGSNDMQGNAVSAEKSGRLPDEESVYDEYMVKYNLLCKRFKEYMA